MPLEKRPLDIPIGFYDTKPPQSAGPVGRLTTLENGVTQKFRISPQTASAAAVPSIKVSKRAGFKALSQDVFNGGTAGAVWTNPAMLAELGQSLVVVANTTPYVYAPNLATWEQQSTPSGLGYVMPQMAIKRVPVYAQNSTAKQPDVAVAGDVLAYTWTDARLFMQVLIVDKTGAVVTKYNPHSSDHPIKVVSDGTQFWVFDQSSPTALEVIVLTTHGAIRATASIGTITAATTWDVIYDSALGVSLVWNQSGSGTTVTYLTVGGLGVTRTEAILATIDSTFACSFATPTGDGFVYVNAIDAGPTLKVYQVDATPAITHTYATSTLTLTDVANVTSYVKNSAKDVVVFASLTPPGAPLTWSTVTQQITFAGVVTTKNAILSAIVATRVFNWASDGRWYMGLYYASNFNGPAGAGSQPTFFLYDIVSQTVVGSWDGGIAAEAEWIAILGSGTPSGHIPHVALDSAGKLHMALGYISEQETSQATARTGPGHFSPYTTFKHGVGVEDIVFTATPASATGIVNGPPTVIAGEMLIPSIGSTTTTGTIWSESNFWIGQEQPTLGQSTVGGGALTLTGTYSFIVVDEWMDGNGNWTRGTPSPPISITLTGSNNTVTLTIPSLRLTQKPRSIKSVYQTANAGTLYYKISDDLAPLYNNPIADTVTFVTGTIADAALPLHQELYTDGNPTPLSNEAAPPHTVSILFGGRVWLYGYDGALWFSKTHTDGLGTAYSSGLRIPLDVSIGVVTSMQVMDNRLILFSSTGVWIVVGDPPDDNGQGTFPVIISTPVTVGCDGVTVPMRDGVMYSSPNHGGIWLLRRDLTAVYIGAAVEDSTLTGQVIAGGVIGSLVFFQLYASGTILVYDTVLGGWAVWPMVQGNALGGCVWSGQGTPQWTWVNSNFSVTTQTAGYYGDETLAPGDAVAIPLVVGFNSLNFAGVGGFQRVYNLQILGTYVDTHSLSVTLDYDQIPVVVETFAFTPDPASPWRYEFRPMMQKCTSVDVLVTEVPVGLTAGYTLENLAALVGVKEGLDKVRLAQRITGV